MRRVCFLLKVRPDRVEEYRRRHQAVWPEMRAALSDSGWRNYSLFLRDDVLLVGYLETDDFAAAQEAMARTDVNARWQAEMAVVSSWRVPVALSPSLRRRSPSRRPALAAGVPGVVPAMTTPLPSSSPP